MDKKRGVVRVKVPTTAQREHFMGRRIKTQIVPISDEFVPEYQTEGSACCDVRANLAGLTITLGAGESGKIPVGFKLQLPPGYEAQIRSRSGMAARAVFLSNGIGTIDEDYPDEVAVLLTNLGSEPLEIKHGDRIAQMALKPVFYFDFDVVDTLDSSTDRMGGFGSTGYD